LRQLSAQTGYDLIKQSVLKVRIVRKHKYPMAKCRTFIVNDGGMSSYHYALRFKSYTARKGLHMG